MSTVKTKKVQLGTDATATNNFTIYQPATPDGTLRVGVGNSDSPTEVGRFTSAGYKPATAPSFRASASGSQTLSNTTFTKINFATEIFDTNSNYDTSLSRFTPTVAGYYYIHGMVRFAATTASKVIVARIYKNGTYYTAYDGVTGTSDSSVQTSALVYCNGSTDYIEFYSYQNSGGNLNTGSYNNATVVFEGYLVQQT